MQASNWYYSSFCSHILSFKWIGTSSFTSYSVYIGSPLIQYIMYYKEPRRALTLWDNLPQDSVNTSKIIFFAHFLHWILSIYSLDPHSVDTIHHYNHSISMIPYDTNDNIDRHMTIFSFLLYQLLIMKDFFVSMRIIYSTILDIRFSR